MPGQESASTATRVAFPIIMVFGFTLGLVSIASKDENPRGGKRI